MNIDWNWFFAAFAQCAAALIAIIAAFTISKLLSESEKLEDRTNELSGLIIKKEDLLRKIEHRNFDWHDRLKVEYSYDLNEAIQNREFNNLTSEEALEKLFSIEPLLYGVDNCINYLTDKIDKLKPAEVSTGLGMSILQQTKVFPTIPPDGIWDKLKAERDKISSLKLESLSIIESFHDKKMEVKSSIKNTDPLKYTIYILILALFLTVIYPLHFMPLRTNEIPELHFTLSAIIGSIFSLKGLLLSFLSATIGGLFIYFLRVIYKVESKYIYLYENITESDLEISEYSKYFAEKRI